MDEDPLQRCIEWPGQQAVCGETAAGDCREGKVDGTEDPVKGSRGRDIHPSQQLVYCSQSVTACMSMS